MAVRIFEMSRAQIASGTGMENLVNTPWNAKQNLTVTGTSQQSAEFAAGTNALRVQADEAVVIEIAANPTADATSYKMAAGSEADFWVTPGHKLAYKTA